jgi:hypothetical protein
LNLQKKKAWKISLLLLLLLELSARTANLERPSFQPDYLGKLTNSIL